MFGTVGLGDDFEAEEHAAIAKILVKSLFMIPSSSANMIKAYDMTHSQFYRNKNGKAMFEWEDNNIQTLVAQAFGFAPQEVTDWYELTARDGVMVPGAVKNSDVKRMSWLLSQMLTESDDTQAKFLGAAINAIKSKYQNPEQRKEVMKQLRAQLMHRPDAWNEVTRQSLKGWQYTAQDGISDMHERAKLGSSTKLSERLDKAGMKPTQE